MKQEEFMDVVKGHMDFVVYAIVAVIILAIGMVLVGDPEGIGISFTTLSNAEESAAGSVLTAIGGWLLFTFIVSFIIHRRAEKEARYEIRATSLLLARFLTEMDKAEIETIRAYGRMNRSMLIATTRESLLAQGYEEREVEETLARLGKLMDQQMVTFDNDTRRIRLDTEARLKGSLNFDMLEPGGGDISAKDVLKFA